MTNHCGRLDPHPGHEWTGYAGGHYLLPIPLRPADRICPGEVVIEGGAECVLHQAPIATCGCEAERRRRWET